jgi:dTDP-glucose pyrophosphorylase
MTDYQRYIITDTATVLEAMIALNDLSGDVQTLFVLDATNRLIGTLTDGDIRRSLIKGVTISAPVTIVMLTAFRSVEEKHINVEEIIKLREKKIALVPCLDKQGHIVRLYNLNKLRSVLPIDAVIMAGGKGERLRPLTGKTPKPLLRLGSKSIIDYNVDNLITYGVDRISVTVNYLKEQIEDHFKQAREGVQISCIREPKFLGTMGSVKLLDSFQNDIVLVMNSDLFTNIDFEHFYMHFLHSNADMLVAAVPYSVNVPYGIFELADGDIHGVLEKPTYNYYANAGIYLFKKKLLDLIPPDTNYDATDFIVTLLSKGFKVTRFPLTGYWIDIGKPEDYQKAQDLVKHL